MPSISAEFDPPTFAATYYDGKTAQRHEVSVRLRAGTLDVIGQDGGVVDQWLYDEVELSDQGRAGSRVIRRGTEARLLLADPLAFAQLKARAPKLLSQRSRTLRNMGISVGAMVAIIVAGYFSLPLLSGAIVALIPLQTEARIGDAYAKQVASFFAPESDGALCEAAAGREALDVIVTRLAAHTSGPFAYRVEVLDTPLVNAVALPGGRIFLFRGLLNKAESPDEVAGVLAHEMEHVNARHGMQGLVRSYGVSMLADLMFGGAVMGNVSSLLMMMSYSRDAEVAADAGAITTLHRAGIDTAGMTRFFKRLREQDDDGLFGLPQFLSTHPPSAAREALVRDRAKTASPAPGPAPGQALGEVLNDAEWAALQVVCK